jgi:hypothetical protein
MSTRTTLDTLGPRFNRGWARVPLTESSISIIHGLQTTNARVFAIPTYDTPIWRTSFDANAITLSFQLPAPDGAAIYWFATRVGTLGRETIAANALSATITHSLGNASNRALALPSWNTVVYSSTPGANSTVLNFSTPAPTGGGELDWIADPDEDELVGSTSITADSTTGRIPHGRNFIDTWIFAMARWNTSVWLAGQTDNQAILDFNTPAPTGGSSIDWRTEIAPIFTVI